MLYTVEVVERRNGGEWWRGRDLPFTGATVPIKLGVSANHLNKSLLWLLSSEDLCVDAVPTDQVQKCIPIAVLYDNILTTF